ncbi:MAG: CRTAC1 family protein [Bryobacteraceae bacterium]
MSSRLCFTLLLFDLLVRGQSGVSPVGFRNVAQQGGLDFVLHNCPTSDKRMIEAMAGGVAVFDYDGDGRPDIFFANGAEIPALAKSGPKYWNRLYRNEGGFQFRDVTASAGVAGEGYSMGVAAADYDNDGRADFFVAGVNRDILYHNARNGRFEDVTRGSGIRGGQWAVAAGWFDYDNDGLLDLWVVHYAKWSVEENRYCGDAGRGIRIYCHPKYFEPLPSTLYHNLGHGRFEDVSTKAGIAEFAGRGMSVAFADYDSDGYQDVFVTNDNMPNFLFRNRGNGKFEEVGLTAGVALRGDGKAVASMGADFRDYDNDGLPDISFTALAAETFPLFRNVGKGSFDDATYSSRLGALTVRHSGWGVGLFDFNNDGWKDLFTAGSHVNDRVEAFESAVYQETNRVFVNLHNGTFRDESEQAGLQGEKAHRGSAYADFDGDGKVDVVVSSLEGAAEVWQNVSPEANHWVVIKLMGVKSNRDGMGARVQIGNQHNHMTSAVSYASSSLGGMHFGLGNLSVVPEIEVIWPSGLRQTVRDMKANQVLTFREPVR